jgi:cobalamin-dependent methionine synthase I
MNKRSFYRTEWNNKQKNFKIGSCLKALCFSLIFIALNSCSIKSSESSILGGWNLIHIYKDSVDILGNDKYKKAYFLRNMYIEKRKIDQITIELDRNTDIYADFQINNGLLTLSRSTHPEFEGKYEIELIDTVSEFFKSRVKSLKLSHTNKNIQIYGAIPTSD